MFKKQLVIIVMLLMSLAVPLLSAQAQANLIVNGNMEGGFASAFGVTGVPLNWGFVKLSGNMDADRQSFAPYSRSAPTFWAMRGTYSTFLGAGYQNVLVTPNTSYRLEAYAFIWSCNDNVYSCIPADAPRFSQKESGMRVRIGVDPNSGDDPNSAEVVWGPWVQPFDAYQGLTLDVTATAGQLTVFLMADSGQAMVWNEAYWDDVSLTQIAGIGQTVTTNTTTTTTQPVVVAPPPSNLVPFVSPQQARPDGSLVHVVNQNDTFDAIAYAYSNLGLTRDAILQANGWTFPPQFIFVGQEIIILPPGSVDPTTGQLLSLTGNAVASTAPSQDLSGEGVPVGAPEVVQTAPITTAPVTPSFPRTLTAAEAGTIPPVEPIAPFLP